MSVTVIIPSYKRAEYLVTAIESVKRQTAFAAIDQIIVSENSDDPRSRAVCEQFSELNISFFEQQPPLTALEHISWIIDQSESEYTAMLHDDDWWYPTHLENALVALEAGSAAYFSNFIFAKNEINSGAFFHHPNVIGLFANEKSVFKTVTLNFADICAICYLYTPFHMSSVVARTIYLKEANNLGLKVGKPWYADRILYPFLGYYGTLAFNAQVLVGVREHPLNDAKTINQSERYESHTEGSLKISELARSRGIDVLKIWEDKAQQVSTGHLNELFDIADNYFGVQQQHMFIRRPVVEIKKMPLIKRLIKAALPYGLVKYLSNR